VNRGKSFDRQFQRYFGEKMAFFLKSNNLDLIFAKFSSVSSDSPIESSPNCLATFYHGNSWIFISTKNGFGYLLGDFFTGVKMYKMISQAMPCRYA
jgi:hypothetical protein